MRFNRIHLVGLAALAGFGATAKDASANDVTISTATTTPLTTSAPDGASPGDVTIASGGSITVTAGQTAVTVNTSNDVNVQAGGSLASNGANDTTGILLLGGNTGTITNAGVISLLEDNTPADTDSDGDLDGEWAIGTARNGIWLSTAPQFTGNIINSGQITIEGDASAGIRLDAPLNGDLQSTGSIHITGDNSYAVAINGGAAGGVTGDVIVRGNVNVRGANSVGVAVNAPISGELRINGSWTVTGFLSTAVPEDQSHLDADDLRIGGSAISIRDNVAGGVTIEGIGVEDDLDDDNDGLQDGDVAETNDDQSTTINVYGSSPAILVQAGPLSNLTLGATASGFGLHVRGAVAAAGLFDGIGATALRIEGDAGGSTATITGGVAIDNLVSASASDADAYGLYIGNNAIVPNLVTRRIMTAAAGSDATFDAYTIYLASGATAPTLTNSGTLRAQFFGETGNATVITDLSNTLTTITNSGTIQAQVIATDDDPNDGIPPPPITGAATAINLSASTVGVTLNQIPDAVFTDDDAVDNDSLTRPAVLIDGDILFGTGADAINLLAGAINGDVSFGDGADSFVINNGATFTGRLSDTGALTVDVINGAMTLTGGTVNLTTAHFGANSTLGVTLSPSDNTLILASGTVTFDAGSRVTPIVPEGLPSFGAFTFLTAGTLVGAGNVTGLVTGEGTPFLYDLSIDTVLGDPNSLEADFILKTPAALGLTTNQSAAFNEVITALQGNADASAAIVTLETQYDFLNAYEDLMPTYASGATELATTAIQQAQSASTNRLAATRLHGLNEVSAWAQEIGYALNREPPTANGQEFRGQGFGFAAGIDGPLNNGALFGLSAAFVTSEVEEPGRPEGELSTWITQGNAYLGTAMGPIDLDFVAGVGVGKMKSRRFIEIGDAFSALSEADWWAYEGHAAARASAPMSVSEQFVITPQAALTFVHLNESGYTEEGAGSLDFDADDATSQRLWGDAGVEFSARWRLRGGGIVAPRIYAGYRANLIDDGGERTFRFVSGGSDFTLTDDVVGDGGPLVGLGFDASNGYSTFSLAYEGEFGDQIDRHSLNAAVRFRF